MTPAIRETPAWPPAPKGARFGALRREVQRQRQMVVVFAGIATAAMALTMVGLLFLAVGLAVHAGGRPRLGILARRTAWTGAAGALVGALVVAVDESGRGGSSAGEMAWAALVGFALFATPTAAIGLLFWAGRGTGRRPRRRAAVVPADRRYAVEVSGGRLR